MSLRKGPLQKTTVVSRKARSTRAALFLLFISIGVKHLHIDHKLKNQALYSILQSDLGAQERKHMALQAIDKDLGYRTIAQCDFKKKETLQILSHLQKTPIIYKMHPKEKSMLIGRHYHTLSGNKFLPLTKVSYYTIKTPYESHIHISKYIHIDDEENPILCLMEGNTCDVKWIQHFLQSSNFRQ